MPMIHRLADCMNEKIPESTNIWQFCVIFPHCQIGENCNICSHVLIENDVKIGNSVTIKSGVQVWDGIEIEDDVFIGSNVAFTNDMYPKSRNKNWVLQRTKVCRGASIGANATILPGLTIGENALIGAGSVVTKNIPPHTIWVGNPAKFIKYRDEEHGDALVSLVVATYNSSATVIETLESFFRQTYHNLELIVTDDCSTDETVNVCRNWLEKHSDRFVRVLVVTTKQNTGVSGNFNRGILASQGQWIKTIAGDDILASTAIQDYMHYIKNSKDDVQMCVSDVEPFASSGEIPENITNAYENFIKFAQEPYPQQWNRIKHRQTFVGPTFFYSRELYDKVGGFDEKYGNCEEWPFVYKVLKSGYRVFAIDKKLVKYRVSANTLSRKKESCGLGNYNLFLSTYRFFFDYPFRDLLKEHHYMAAYYLSMSYLTDRLRYSTNNSKFSRILKSILCPNADQKWVKKLVKLQDKLC